MITISLSYITSIIFMLLFSIRHVVFIIDFFYYFQDLLQLQYEGVSVMKMYKAKINVNLLIFLLNKKFYGK